VDVRLVVAEGDSTDATLDHLKQRMADDDTLLKVDHGGPRYGSVDHPERWDQIAMVFRATAERVEDPGDAFIWVESDLLWRPEVMLGLLTDLGEVEAVSPLILCDGGLRFYDVYGYKIKGQNFEAMPPYYPPQEPGLVKIDSAGSCFATTDWDAVARWSGHWPYPAEGRLWLDPSLVVTHP
jgi:hypothetical protein